MTKGEMNKARATDIWVRHMCEWACAVSPDEMRLDERLCRIIKKHQIAKGLIGDNV